MAIKAYTMVPDCDMTKHRLSRITPSIGGPFPPGVTVQSPWISWFLHYCFGFQALYCIMCNYSGTRILRMKLAVDSISMVSRLLNQGGVSTFVFWSRGYPTPVDGQSIYWLTFRRCVKIQASKISTRRNFSGQLR